MGFSQAFAFRDCPWCGLRDAQMHVLSADDATGVPGSHPRYWALLACPRCGGPTVIETNESNTGPNRLIRVVPDTATVENVSDLPDDVRDYYGDAIRVLQAGVPDAAAVELRRTLEAAAAHFDVTDGPLVGRIESLIEKGLITAQFGDVLHHIRQVGNVGAHASATRVGDEAAQRALRFTTQVLRNLFEIPAELLRLQPDVEPEDEASS